MQRSVAAQVGIPDGFDDLLALPGWANVWTRLDEVTVERLQDEFNIEHLLDYLDQDRAFDGFCQEVYGFTARPLFGGLEPTGPTATQLADELTTVGRLAPGVSDDERNRAVTETMFDLAEAQVRQRLGLG